MGDRFDGYTQFDGIYFFYFLDVLFDELWSVWLRELYVVTLYRKDLNI